MAARAGIVVYTMEAGAIYSDPAVDAGRNDFPDGMGSGTSARMPSTESSAMREPLRILADDTGGRALVNSNSIPGSIQQALDETSAYYLLAWRPDSAAERTGKARLKVVIKNRPDLRVRLRNNYYVPEKPAAQSGQPGTAIANSAAKDQLLPVMWHQQLSLAPGLYQVRVAVRERDPGRMGGAQQWIQVPDLSRGNLQMSSLFVAERKAPSTEQANGPGSLPVNINLRFARSSVLRYQTYLYNVAEGMAPDIEIQERVLQDGKTFITMPARKVPTDPMKDHASVPY